MGEMTAFLNNRVNLLTISGQLVELPQALDTDGGFKVHIQNPLTISGTVGVSGTVAATQSGPWTTGRNWSLSSVTDTVTVVGSELFVQNAIEDLNYDLQAAAYSRSTAINENFKLNRVEFTFTTRAPRDLRVRSENGSLFYESLGNTALSVSIDGEDDAFSAGDEIIIEVTQTGSACIMDAVVVIVRDELPFAPGSYVVSQGSAGGQAWLVNTGLSPLTDAQLRASAVSVIGPLTDTQLRASALNVLGPLTDTQLRATPVVVSTGLTPLTDTQLRATAVPISAVSLPLPAGAATETTLGSILTRANLLASESTLAGVKTGTDRLDVTFSSVRDALRGISAKTLTDLDSGIQSIFGRLDVTLSTRASEATLATRASEVTLSSRASETTLAAVKLKTDNLDLPLTTLNTTVSSKLEEATFTSRINTQGQKASAASTPVVLSTEQQALLAAQRVAAFYAGSAAATGNVSTIDAIDVSSMSVVDFHFVLTAGADLTLVVEGTNDPTAVAGDGAVKGWSALTLLSASSGARSASFRNTGRYALVNPPRFIRVRCSTYVSGSATINAMAKPLADQDNARFITDQDGLARWALTTFGQGQVAQRTYLCGGNFDGNSLDAVRWQSLDANGGNKTFADGLTTLHTSTASNGRSGVRSYNLATFIGAADNVITLRLKMGDTGGADHLYRYGIYDDNNGVFVEVDSTGYKYKFRKNGVDAESPFGLLGISKITPTTSLQLWEVMFNPNFVIFRNSGNFVQILLGDATLSAMMAKYDLPITAEVINTSGTIDHTLALQTLVAERLGQPHTIRANEVFDDEDVLSATAAVIQGAKPDNTRAQVTLTQQGDLRVGQQGVPDLNNRTTGVTLLSYSGTPYVPNVGGAPGATGTDMWVGGWTDSSNFAQFSSAFTTTQAGRIFAEWSVDGGTTISGFQQTDFGTAGVTSGGQLSIPADGASHFRLLYQNRTAVNNTVKFNTILRYLPLGNSLFPAASTIDGTFPAAVVKNLGTAMQPSGLFVNEKADGLIYINTATQAGGATLTTSWFGSDGWKGVELVVKTDQLGAANGIVVEYTDDATAVTPTVIHTMTRTFNAADLARGSAYYPFPVIGGGFRIKYTNGATVQGSFRLTINLRTAAVEPPSGGLETTLSTTTGAITTRSVLAGKNPADSSYNNVSAIPILEGGQTVVSIPVVSGARPSQVPGRSAIHFNVAGVTADTLARTTTGSKVFYLTDIIVFVTNTNTGAAGRIDIRDSTTAGGGTVRIPISLDAATSQNNASLSMAKAFNEPLPFSSGVYVDFGTGTQTASITFGGYEV